MPIKSLEIRDCVQRQHDEGWSFARGALPELQGAVVVLRDDDGVEGLGYLHAIPAISTHGAGARADMEFLQRRLIGRDPTQIAAIMDEVEKALAFASSAKAAIDMALHDLAARRLGIGLVHLFGGPRRTSIPQSRIIPLKAPDAMAEAACKLVEAGFRTVKVKLDGDMATDVARVAAVRQAVGPGVTITLDPNQAYSAKGMIRAFGRMDAHDIALIEQPVPAADLAGLKQVTAALPVPVEADESATSVADVMRLVTDRTVDVINLKITKLGGIRNMMSAIAICEAGGVAPRLGAAFGPALLQAASAHVAATLRRLDFACELSEHLHLRDDPFTPVPVVDGVVTLPEGTGTGVTWTAK